MFGIPHLAIFSLSQFLKRCSLVDEVHSSTSSTSELLCNTTKLDCMIVYSIQMQFYYCKMHWCKSVQACLAFSQECICLKFQMNQIPNVGGLLNHIAQPKLMITVSHACVPKSTISNTTWGVRVFNEWVKARNSGAFHANICPEDLLIHSHPISVLDYWLASFVLEARRQDGNYRIFPLLSACAYISTGRKPALNSEVRLITRCA